MLVLLFFILTRRSSFALPVALPSLASDDDLSPVSSSTRSVVGIIWSCVTTIFACTWIAVHPNLPSEDDSEWTIYWRRVRIMMVALIVPEYVILWAANQLRSAKHAVQTLQKFPACRDWSVTHGMFLIMGGFVLTDHAGKRLGVIQENDLIKLLSSGNVAFPALSSSHIMDRSKGDAVTKALVLLQTTWFIMQVASRAIQHMLITELELTTLAFAFLNVLTYVLWWAKPLDVRHPILIKFQGSRSEKYLLPEMCFAHRQSMVTLDEAKVVEVDITDAFHDAHTEESSEAQIDIHSIRSYGDSSFSAQLKSFSGILGRLHKCLPRPAELWRSLNTATRAFMGPWASKPVVEDFGTALTSTLHVTQVSTPEAPQMRVTKDIQVSAGGSNPYDSEDALAIPTLGYITRVPTFYGGPPLIYFHGLGTSYPIALQMLIGSIFGGIHCAAWIFQFHSKAEQTLWRTASLYIAASPIVLWVLRQLIVLATWQIDVASPFSQHRYFIAAKILAPVFRWTQPFRAIFMLYIVARLIILLLAIVALRDLPDGALETVQWATFIPHI